MIRRNTWLLLFVLAVLIGFSYYLAGRKSREAAQATPTVGSLNLFSAADGAPTDIKVENASGDSVEVGLDQSGAWVVKAPTAGPADQASAEAAATQVGALRVLATVELGPDVIGLDKPAYTITITFGSGKSHKVLVGSVNPIQSGYYVQMDAGPNQVVDKFGLDALLNMVTNPPYPATATPAASATPTASPVTQATETPPTPASPGQTASSTPQTAQVPATTASSVAGTSTP